MSELDQTMETIARQIQIALDTADLSAFGELLDPEVKWGPPHAGKPPCKNRDQVLAWYQRRKASGVEGRVSEVEVLGECVVVCLVLGGTQTAKERGGSALRWQVYTVSKGRVIDIVGFDDRSDAIDYAQTRMHYGS